MPLHNSVPSSSPIKKQDLSSQGIVTILRSDNTERTNWKTPSSIRRTLSADMSSKKWLHQNDFLSPMKNISSSELISDDKMPGQDEVWRSIQAQKQQRVDADGDDQPQKPTLWGSILVSQKSDSGSDLPPPYVHPLVKRSTSSLSKMSLEICTESLGSETGSVGFPSDQSSEISGEVEDPKLEEKKSFRAASTSPFEVAKYRESPARSFPPPLGSIAAGAERSSLQVHSHRENGRLVLEAVSVPARNFLQAERGDGRLVLTLINSQDSEKVEEDGGDDEHKEEEVAAEEEEIDKFSKEEEKFSGIISLQKPMVLKSKTIVLRNANPTWNTKLMKATENVAAAEEKKLSVHQSLPPLPPPVSALIPPSAAAFNAYEYFWRNKTGGSVSISLISTGQQPPSFKINKNMGNIISGKEYDNHNQELILVKGNREELPYLRGCKESKRSLLIWENFCISTT